MAWVRDVVAAIERFIQYPGIERLSNAAASVLASMGSLRNRFAIDAIGAKTSSGAPRAALRLPGAMTTK